MIPENREEDGQMQSDVRTVREMENVTGTQATLTQWEEGEVSI